MVSGKLPAAEQLLDLGMSQLYPGWTAVIALARARSDLHLTKQGIHLGDRQDPACPDRAVTGDGGGDVV